MSDRPLLLVSNDDGVDAVGIIALRQALSTFADVYTVAPQTEQSAKSHSITLHHPLR
ncbi:MAG: 5'/3'-nucleotidase SurE, partial [Myxococcales bacterium]